MPNPAASGYIYRTGVVPNTSLLNTQRVRLYGIDVDGGVPGNFVPIGLVQSWNPSQTRAIEPGRGIGFGDQIAELAVGVTDLTASCSIMMMYLRDMMQVFGYKAGSSGFVRALKHHKWPFDVKEEIVVPVFLGTAGNGATAKQASAADFPEDNQSIITIYEACWMSDYSKAFNMGDTMTTQDSSITITDVYAGPSRNSQIPDDFKKSLMYNG